MILFNDNKKDTGTPHPRSKLTNVLLIDDDPVFTTLMKRIAKNSGIEVTLCQTVADFGVLVVAQRFDVAIVDIFLDGIKRDLRGPEIAKLFNEIPVIFISGNRAKEAANWDDGSPIVKKVFMNKSSGPEAILATALNEWNSHRLKLLAQSA